MVNSNKYCVLTNSYTMNHKNAALSYCSLVGLFNFSVKYIFINLLAHINFDMAYIQVYILAKKITFYIGFLLGCNKYWEVFRPCRNS